MYDTKGYKVLGIIEKKINHPYFVIINCIFVFCRIAKRFVDGKNFYGGLLHVFYAPELESVAETRKKLMQRRRDVGVRLKRQQHDAINLKTVVFEPRY